MIRPNLWRATLAAMALLMARPLMAQAPEASEPHVENAHFEKRAVEGLASEIKKWTDQAAQPQWLGYAVPQISGNRTICCGNYDASSDDRCGTCRLEDRHSGDNVNSSKPATAKLEGPRYLVVLFRAENKRIAKIRVASEECTLEIGRAHV